MDLQEIDRAKTKRKLHGLLDLDLVRESPPAGRGCAR
jgi:hypothetical protein